MDRQKIKLFCNPWGHYATLYIDEVKEIKQNGPYWFIEMKDGNYYGDCECFSFTSDPNEKIGYFIEDGR